MLPAIAGSATDWACPGEAMFDGGRRRGLVACELHLYVSKKKMHSSSAIQGTPGVTLLSCLSDLVEQGYCQSVLHLASTVSTNAVAMSEAATGAAAPLPRLIVADQQTGGRGRLGRSWHSDDGTLTMSLAYPLAALRLPDDSVPLVALAAGMAVADAVEMMVPPIQTRLKWPNDVYAGGGKVAGILVETCSLVSRRLVVGIGVNVATDLSRADAEVSARARSLDALCGRPLHRYDLLPLIVVQLQQRLEQLAADRSELVRQYRLRCLLAGRQVRVLQHGQTLQGTVLQIETDGSLSLVTDAGVIAIRSGEMVL